MELRPPPLRLRPARAPPRDPGNAADHCQGGEQLNEPICFRTPVRRIEWRDKDETVHADDSSVVANHVIVVLPPSLAGTIEYALSLPANRAQVTQRFPQALVYDRPFLARSGLATPFGLAQAR